MQIDGYVNYALEEDGSVINVFTGHKKSPRKNTAGYLSVDLNEDGKRYSVDIHRLLARHYIPNPHNLPYVDHIDRNRLNNKLSNLRWLDGTKSVLNSSVQTRPLVNIKFSRQRWVVCLHRYRTLFYIGSFKKIEDAIDARDDWKRVHPDF